jgi:hypothetical protein
MMNNTTREATNQISSGNKCLVPKLERHGGMSQQRKAYINNMAVFSLSKSILLMCLWARNIVVYAYTLKGVKPMIFTTSVGLHSNNFPIEETFYQVLKVMKALKNFRFVSKQINPSKLTVIINETNIIIVLPKRSWCRTPYIRKYKIQWIIRHTRGLGIGQFMALPLLARITHDLFIGLCNEREFILAKDLMNDGRRWMAQATVPSRGGRLDGAEGLFGWTCLQGVESPSTSAVKKHPFPCLLLNKKEIRMKL